MESAEWPISGYHEDSADPSPDTTWDLDCSCPLCVQPPAKIFSDGSVKIYGNNNTQHVESKRKYGNIITLTYLEQS